MRLSLIPSSLLIALICFGCLQSPSVVTPSPPIVSPFVSPGDPTPLSVEIPNNLVESLFIYLGPKNAITLKSSQTIVLKDVKVEIPAGCSFAYEFTKVYGQLVFLDPAPKITITKYGLNFHPKLTMVKFTTPSIATVYAHELGTVVTHEIDLGPSTGFPPAPSFAPPKAAAPVPADLPIVYLWTMPNCVPCVSAKTYLTTTAGLPFKVVINPAFTPGNMPSTRPFLQFTVNNKVYTKTGWDGGPQFLKFFKDRQTLSSQSLKEMSRYQGKIAYIQGMTPLYHLTTHHGFKEYDLKPYSNPELIRIHSACHKEDDLGRKGPHSNISHKN